MSTSAISQSVGKAPCGCGCSGASSSAPCTCGGASCTTCQSQAYVRPEFFAGQLLTEDDLQSLVNYVAAKNRLHARYLFGPGVVCGLEVKREPCKCGQVVVEPGYALDCCGNDIVLPCPQTLDINKMINALMMKLRKGYDCGDPCAEQEAADASSSVGTNSSINSSASGNGDNGNQSTSRPKRYCLYVNYCEQETDPVTPYATSTPCGPSVCQNTRVQEGFTFELRCPKKDCDCTPAICQTLSSCQGDSKTADAIANQARTLEQIANPIALAARRIHQGKIPEPNVEALTHANIELERWLHKEGEHVDLARLRELMFITRKAASDLARFVKPERQADGVLLTKTVPILKTHRHRFPTILEQSYVDALAEVIQKLTELLKPKDKVGKIPDLGLEIRFLQWGAVMTRGLLKDSVGAVREVREWLLDRMEQTGVPADPSLESGAKYSPALEQFNVQDLWRFATLATEVSQKCLQFSRDCYCNALLPPCSTCTDTGVLLACVTVQDCCVTEICNLDREFVLTGPNLRYWFPEIQWLGCEIEKCCCPSRDCKDSFVPTVDEGGDFTLRNFCEAFFRVMQAACGDRKRTLAARTDAYRNLFSTVLAQAGKLEAGRDILSTDHSLATALDEIREEIRTLKIENAKLRKELRAEKKSKPPET